MYGSFFAETPPVVIKPSQPFAKFLFSGGNHMKVREIMTEEPDCCTPDDTAQKAASIMKHGDTGAVPIVRSRSDASLAGIVTDRDLCLGIVAEGKDPRTVRVQDCMTDNVIRCKPDDDVQRVLELMGDNQIRRIPVVEQDGRV